MELMAMWKKEKNTRGNEGTRFPRVPRVARISASDSLNPPQNSRIQFIFREFISTLHHIWSRTLDRSYVSYSRRGLLQFRNSRLLNVIGRCTSWDFRNPSLYRHLESKRLIPIRITCRSSRECPASNAWSDMYVNQHIFTYNVYPGFFFLESHLIARNDDMEVEVLLFILNVRNISIAYFYVNWRGVRSSERLYVQCPQNVNIRKIHHAVIVERCIT